MLRFILCADDFALSEGVGEAILRLLGQARLSATGAMTNRANWRESAARLREFSANADLGVHLNLTCGASLGLMSRLAPSGELPRLGAVLRGALLGRLPLAEIAEEFRRQIDAFTRAIGREPDFLDGHQHIHAFPGIRDALLAAVDALGLGRRIYIRDPADGFGAIASRRLGAAKALLIAGLAKGFAERLAAVGLAANIGFAGIGPFDPRRDYGADFPRFLRAPGRRHLVMCHPGFIDPELLDVDSVGATRPKEYEFLSGDAWPELLARLDARTVRFREFDGC
jgi:predicted glycoside hydrolase/deacetylase ChbG (UPF0249 family)